MKNTRTNGRLVKNAGYVLTVTAIVIAVVILINVLASAIPVQYTRFDMTKTSLYTATSQETEECLELLDQDIIFYYICAAGSEDITVQTFIENYAALSDRITYKVIDPVVYPNFASQYDMDNVVSNTLVVVNENLKDDSGEPLSYVIQGGHSSYISAEEAQSNSTIFSEFYGWKIDTNAYYTSGETVYYPATFIAEQQMAKAINYVTNTEWPQVYVLTGHGEDVEAFSVIYPNINNDIIQFNTLILGNEIPEDCKMILVYQPIYDLTEAEYGLLSEYLNDGGDIIFMMSHSDKSDLANFSRLFESYGFAIDYDHFVLENSPSRLLDSRYPYIFAPIMTDSPVFEQIRKNNIYVISYYAMPISETDSHRNTIKFNKLCYTDTGYLATWTEELPDNSKSYSFITAAHIVEAYEDVETNIYVFSGQFADKYYNYFALADILKSVCDVQLAVEIDSVDLAYDYLNLLESEATFWSTIVQIVIPVAVLVVGIVIFVIRRRK